jgi:hypothetical protein
MRKIFLCRRTPTDVQRNALADAALVLFSNSRMLLISTIDHYGLIGKISKYTGYVVTP